MRPASKERSRLKDETATQLRIMIAGFEREMANLDASIASEKSGRPVQFEITEQTRASLEVWLRMIRTAGSRYLFPSRLHARPHLSTRQYSRLVHRWVDSIGLESISYGTHSMRRTKATQIYRKTGNLRAVQLLLGHTKLESTIRYLGIEVDDALNIAEQIEL